MDGFGDQLLAGAAFAGNQHGSMGGGDARYRLQDPLQERGLADDLVPPERTFRSGIRCRAALLYLDRGTDRFQQCEIVPRLGDEIERSGPDSLYGQMDRTPCGDQDYRDFRRQHLDFRQQLQSLFAGGRTRIVHIHQDQSGDCSADLRHGLFRRFRRRNPVAGPLQHQR